MMTVVPHVLVVDDDPSVRKSLTRLLASADYAVEAYASAREFLAREPYPGPCCLLQDVRMPGLTGIQLQGILPRAAACRSSSSAVTPTSGRASRP